MFEGLPRAVIGEIASHFTALSDCQRLAQTSKTNQAAVLELFRQKFGAISDFPLARKALGSLPIFAQSSDDMLSADFNALQRRMDAICLPYFLPKVNFVNDEDLRPLFETVKNLQLYNIFLYSISPADEWEVDLGSGPEKLGVKILSIIHKQRFLPAYDSQRVLKDEMSKEVQVYLEEGSRSGRKDAPVSKEKIEKLASDIVEFAVARFYVANSFSDAQHMDINKDCYIKIVAELRELVSKRSSSSRAKSDQDMCAKIIAALDRKIPTTSDGYIQAYELLKNDLEKIVRRVPLLRSQLKDIFERMGLVVRGKVRKLESLTNAEKGRLLCDLLKKTELIGVLKKVQNPIFPRKVLEKFMMPEVAGLDWTENRQK